MLFIPVLLIMTVLVIAGYFIQLTAQRAEGFLKPFGKYLSLWVFVLAGLVVIGAAVNPGIGRGFGGPGRPEFARAFGPRFGPGRGFGLPRFERRVPREGAQQQPQNNTPAPATPPAAPANP
jgi:hypothetical protein